MRAIILAAGFGTRLCETGTNKAAIKIGNYRSIIDYQLDALRCQPEIDQIHIVHNHRDRQWFSDLRDRYQGLCEAENAENAEKTAGSVKIILTNDGARSPEEARGACGSLRLTLKYMPDYSGFILVCVDTLATYLFSEFVRHINTSSLYSEVLLGTSVVAPEETGSYARIGRRGSRINSIDERQKQDETDSCGSTVWLGPAFFPGVSASMDCSLYKLLEQHSDDCKKDGNKADGLGDFLAWWIGRQILLDTVNVFGEPHSPTFRCWDQPSRSIDVGNPEALAKVREAGI